MIKFENMQQYTEWLKKESDKLQKNEMILVEIASISKKICVCGSPLRIEEMAEKGATEFMKEWTEYMQGKEEKVDVDNDVDLLSDLREAILMTFEKYMNMEIVFVSTEY